MSVRAELARWRADRNTYLRDHIVIGTLGAIGACGLLWWLGNADWWVGAVAAPLAVVVRGWYLASEELALEWVLTAGAVEASNGKRVPLADIEKVRSLGSSVQLVTRSGDKHLMKYLADPTAVRDRIAAACELIRGAQ